MQFITLLPLADNEGNRFGDKVLNRIVRDWSVRFGGATVERDVEGYWLDDEGTLHSDECWRVTVACEDDQYPVAVKAVLRAGRRLKQQAMYFEVRDFDGVRILKMK